MNVNAQNFAQAWPEIQAAIAQCDFMSIDTEMTGLGRGTDRPVPFESPASRYLRIRSSSEGFLVIQFGLSCFRFDEAAATYDVSTFNFYIFPQQLFSIDRRFHCQSGSIRFLASHQFDFNQTFYHGIPFLDRTEEAKVVQEMEQQSAVKAATPQARSDIVMKDEDKTWVTERVAQLRAWQPTAPSGAVLKFDRCSPYHRRLLYQELPKQFPDVKLETIRAEDCIAASFPTAEQAAARELEKKAQREAEYLTGLGFTRVIRAMQSTKRPIIGHNMLLDSLHMFEQFESPLPATLDEFKAAFIAVWPIVYDTKHIASLSPVISKIVTATSLEDAALRTTQEPFSPVALRATHAKYGEAAKLHEAGYDAYLTGCLFLRMCHYLHNTTAPTEAARTLSLASLLPHVAAFRNRIPLARSDIAFFFEGPEEKPDRRNVIHVSGISKATNQAELAPILAKYCPVRFVWINDQSTFVLLEDPTQVQPLLKHLREGGLDPAAFSDWATYEASNAGALADPVETPKQQGARKRQSEAASADVLHTPSSKVGRTEDQAAKGSPAGADAAEEGEFVPGKKKNKRRRSLQTAVNTKAATSNL